MLVGSTQTEVVVVGSDEVVVIPADVVASADVVVSTDVVGLPVVLVPVDVVASAAVGMPDVLVSVDVSAVVEGMLDSVDSIEVVVSARMVEEPETVEPTDVVSADKVEEPEIAESTEVTASLDVAGLLDTTRDVASLEV